MSNFKKVQLLPLSVNSFLFYNNSHVNHTKKKKLKLQSSKNWRDISTIIELYWFHMPASWEVFYFFILEESLEGKYNYKETINNIVQ